MLDSSSTGTALRDIGHLAVAMSAAAYILDAAVSEQVGRKGGKGGVAARNQRSPLDCIACNHTVRNATSQTPQHMRQHMPQHMRDPANH